MDAFRDKLCLLSLPQKGKHKKKNTHPNSQAFTLRAGPSWRCLFLWLTVIPESSFLPRRGCWSQIRGVLPRRTCFKTQGCFLTNIFFYTRRCLLSCVLGVMAFVKFFTLEGVWATPCIYLKSRSLVCMHAGFLCLFLRVWALKCETECQTMWYALQFHSYLLYFFHQKRSWRTSVNHKIPKLTTFLISWPFAFLRRVLLHETRRYSIELFFFNWLSWHFRMLMQLFPKNTLLCQVLYISDELLPLYYNPSQSVPYSNSTQLLVSFLSSR